MWTTRDITFFCSLYSFRKPYQILKSNIVLLVVCLLASKVAVEIVWDFAARRDSKQLEVPPWSNNDIHSIAIWDTGRPRIRIPVHVNTFIRNVGHVIGRVVPHSVPQRSVTLSSKFVHKCPANCFFLEFSFFTKTWKKRDKVTHLLDRYPISIDLYVMPNVA